MVDPPRSLRTVYAILCSHYALRLCLAGHKPQCRARVLPESSTDCRRQLPAVSGAAIRLSATFRHAQHTFPVLVEGAFEEIFSSIDMVKEGQAGIEAGAPDVPAVFEVRMVDLAHDISMEADRGPDQPPP